VTEVLAPAVLVAVVSPLVAWHAGAPGWGLALAVFAAGIPFAFILRGVRRGVYDDHHVGDWRRRPLILLVAGASVLVVLGLMLVFGAPREVMALVAAMLAGLALTLGVTLLARWKVSLHAAVAAGTATTLVLVFGRWLLLAWLAVALVAWARVRVGDHTVAQVLVGVGLGALAAGTVFPLFR
jgi:membrane-associated phospholipid phosphatase